MRLIIYYLTVLLGSAYLLYIADNFDDRALIVLMAIGGVFLGMLLPYKN